MLLAVAINAYTQRIRTDWAAQPRQRQGPDRQQVFRRAW